MLGLKLNHVSKRGQCIQYNVHYQGTTPQTVYKLFKSSENYSFFTYLFDDQIRSNFAHVTTAQLQWYLQNYNIFHVQPNSFLLDFDFES